MYQVALHHIKIEKQENQNQRNSRTYNNNFHGKVALGTLQIAFHIRLPAHLFGCQSHSTLNDAPGLDDADDTGHGNTANADALGIIVEYLFGSHAADSRRDIRVPLIEHFIAPNERHAGNNNPPHN